MNGNQNAMDFGQTESVFIALKALQGIHQCEAELPVLLADVVHYLQGGERRKQQIERAISSDLRVRKQYRMLLQHMRVATAAREALAQDVAELDVRQGDGFRILFRRSRADAGQTYVILELDAHSDLSPDVDYMLLAEDEHTVVRLLFVAPDAGRSQTILPSDDGQLATLKKPDVELSLIPC